MGYSTDYSLTVRPVKNETEFNDLKAVLSMEKFNLIYYAFDSGWYTEKDHTAYFYTYDSVKWYNNRDDMIEISKRFPNMVFMLEGQGELPGDMWKCYFKNGEWEMCEAVIHMPEPGFIHWPEVNEANERIAV